jgi:hypothetical protein
MAGVLRVPVPVVDVVGVAVVRDGDVTAALAVRVLVHGMLGVGGGLAFVHMAVVHLVQVPVVDVIGMALVRDGDVAAARAVDVLMARVLGMRWCAHRVLSFWSPDGFPVCRIASVTTRATCSSLGE